MSENYTATLLTATMHTSGQCCRIEQFICACIICEDWVQSKEMAFDSVDLSSKLEVQMRADLITRFAFLALKWAFSRGLKSKIHDCTMGDVPRILPGIVTKIILARPLVSWVSKDQKFNEEYKYIGFLFDLPVIFVWMTKICLFTDHFGYFWLFFMGFLQITPV